LSDDEELEGIAGRDRLLRLMEEGARSGRRLQPLSPSFAATRSSLHQVAEQILAPARKPDNEIALQATAGGFGTPPFEFEGDERQVRVQGDELVSCVGAEERRSPITSLRAAGDLVAELLGEEASLDDRPLDIDSTAASVLASWYALGASVLDRLIVEADPGDEPSPVTLWPEHFDIAIELGSQAQGLRANYGFSPGDGEHPEPYVYVGPWTAEVEGELWTAIGFSGAELGYAALLAAEDPCDAALHFLRTRKQALPNG
jgi:hypothetical protein